MRDLDTIVSASALLIREAFEAGRHAGRAEASADLKAKLADFLSSGQGAPSTESPGRAVMSSDERATQGSVKPKIVQLVAESAATGTTATEITNRTGFKPNTVRGTLWTLGHEGSIFKRAGRWYPVISHVDEDDAPL